MGIKRRIRILGAIQDSYGRNVKFKILDLSTGKSPIVSLSSILKYADTLEIDNAYIVKGKFLRSKKGALPVLNKLNRKDKSPNRSGQSKILYHGPKEGIQGKIDPHYGRTECDFGAGFYTGDCLLQAQLLVLGEPKGVIYEASVDLQGLSLYDFSTDYTLWALYVIYNRKHYNFKSNKLLDILHGIDGHDVICGPIADDRMNIVIPRFLSDALTDTALTECLTHVKYGNQFVFKSTLVCSEIQLHKLNSLSVEERKALKSKKTEMLKHLEEDVTAIQRKHLRDGRYFSEIVDSYK